MCILSLSEKPVNSFLKIIQKLKSDFKQFIRFVAAQDPEGFTLGFHFLKTDADERFIDAAGNVNVEAVTEDLSRDRT